jgi:uncharacterized protein
LTVNKSPAGWCKTLKFENHLNQHFSQMLTLDSKTIKMKCPHCEVVLVMSERQGIEIDYCPQCRGIWLDRGELDKLIEKAELSSGKDYESKNREERFDTSHRPERFENDDYNNRYKYDKTHPHRKKRGGFLGDLFDFD